MKRKRRMKEVSLQNVRAKIAELSQAIATYKRVMKQNPLVLTRYLHELEAIVRWHNKRSLAETKIRNYLASARRYERRISGNVVGGTEKGVPQRAPKAKL